MNPPFNPIQSDDPPGATFCYYPGPTPRDGWRYELNDNEISYGAGPWPFYRPATEAVLVGKGREARYEYPPVPTSIRLAPDSQYCSWGDWFVGVFAPKFPEDTIISAWTSLRVRPQGLGAIIVPLKVRIDLQADTASIDIACPESLREQAELKTERILAAILEHRAARDAGSVAPVTAHQRWRASQQQHT